MLGQPAIIMQRDDLQHLIDSAATRAAQEVINTFKAELTDDPNAVITKKLRAYIEDRTTIHNPRDLWANSLHIRSIKLNAKGQPRSISWFQKFKVTSGLIHCHSRPSTHAGGQREWCFEDVANAYQRSCS